MKYCPKCSSSHKKPGTFCSRVCANSRGPRDESFKSKAREWQLKHRKGAIAGTKTQEEYDANPRRCVICDTPVPRYRGVGHNRVKTCSVDCLHQLRVKNSLRTCKGLGGKRHGSGRGKKGRYRGIWCDSTYELAYLIYCFDHGIQVSRYDGWFEYHDSSGKLRRYYPDFQTEFGIVEIKGFLTDNDHRKIAACPQRIHLMTKKELAPVFAYVSKKHGVSPLKFWTLYDAC